jgi:hypothetical protein
VQSNNFTMSVVNNGDVVYCIENIGGVLNWLTGS